MFVGHWSEAGARLYSITRSVHVNKQGTSVVGTQTPRLSLTFCRSAWIINLTLLAWWRCQGLGGKALQLWKEAFLIKYKNSLLVLIVLLLCSTPHFLACQLVICFCFKRDCLFLTDLWLRNVPFFCHFLLNYREQMSIFQLAVSINLNSLSSWVSWDRVSNWHKTNTA